MHLKKFWNNKRKTFFSSFFSSNFESAELNELNTHKSRLEKIDIFQRLTFENMHQGPILRLQSWSFMALLAYSNVSIIKFSSICLFNDHKGPLQAKIS